MNASGTDELVEVACTGCDRGYGVMIETVLPNAFPPARSSCCRSEVEPTGRVRFDWNGFDRVDQSMVPELVAGLLDEGLVAA